MKESEHSEGNTISRDGDCNSQYMDLDLQKDNTVTSLVTENEESVKSTWTKYNDNYRFN